MTATKTPAAHKSSAAHKDAIALLKADHEAVSQLFAEFEKTHSTTNKKALVAEICTALSVHAQVEEEIFYPAVKAALKDKLLVPEATVEHAGVKGLIAQLEGAEPDGEMYGRQGEGAVRIRQAPRQGRTDRDVHQGQGLVAGPGGTGCPHDGPQGRPAGEEGPPVRTAVKTAVESRPTVAEAGS